MRVFKRRYFLAGIIVLLTICFLVLLILSISLGRPILLSDRTAKWDEYETKISVGGKAVKADVVRTPQDKERGLSGRKSLCANCGMLFVFDQKGIYPFWMRRMYFDIDILWIAGDRVVDITLDVKKPSLLDFDSPKIIYQSHVPVDKVLEVNSGWVEKNGIRVGDEVK